MNNSDIKYNNIKNKKIFLLYAIIFISALSVRAIMLYHDDGLINTRGDTPLYIAIANSLVNGNGYSDAEGNVTAKRTPLYPIFLTGIYKYLNNDCRTIQAVQIILDSITCLLVFKIAREFLGLHLGFICGLFLSFYLPMASRCLYILSETLFTFLLSCSVLLFVVRRSYIGHYFLPGILLGLAALTRPNGLVIGFTMSIFIIINSGIKKFIKPVALFLAGMTIVISPWIIRNALVFHHFIPTYTYSGIAFYNSYYIPESGFGFNKIKPEHEEYYSIDNEVDKNKYLIKVTLQYIEEKPIQTIKLIPYKLAGIIYPFDMHWLRPGFSFRYNIFWGTIFIFGLFGIFSQAFRKEKEFHLLVFLILPLIITSVIFWGDPRMRAPYDPFISIIAVLGFRELWKRNKRFFWIASILCFHVIIFIVSEFSVANEYLKSILPW